MLYKQTKVGKVTLK